MMKYLTWMSIAVSAITNSQMVLAQDKPNLLPLAPLSCLLEPSFDVELSSEVQGVIKNIDVQRGDRVKKGQTVMVLESKLEAAAVNTVKARLEFATRKVERNTDLFKKNLISDIEQDEMMTEVRLAAFQLKEARVRLGLRETKSPIEGVVIQRYKDPGEFVDETPFLRIATLNPMHAEIVLPAELYGTIKKGDTFNVTALGSDQIHQGTVKVIDPIIDAASNTFAIALVLDNEDGVLSAGLRCEVRASSLAKN
ncbi:efflux RND transporter periplasmic adaptor subunit [Vibrio taketomensis]|uniref:efflux RND transporter periplasmic adaptor subunit n=1 Tax=Vibrio taketomensis TaxID=2572923 RepID=UPI00138A39EF|nr:efflux RND transporter periplasmic adaptor subunit [Vibrio taketomensis]